MPVDVDVTFFDGTCHFFPACGDGHTVGHLRRKLQQRTGHDSSRLATLSCDGAVLRDSVRLAELPAHRKLSAWYPRYSQSRSESRALAQAKLLSSRVGRGHLAAKVKAAIAEFVSGWLRQSTSLRAWAKLGLWVAISAAFKRGDFLGPWLVASLVGFISAYGFSERRSDEESAYTVFNGGRALPGQLRAEDLQRNVVGI
jgi:hypothetical protein